MHSTMKRKIFALVICTIFTTLSSLAQTPPDNEVWYTTTDGKKAELYEGNDNVNFKIISHTYANGKGVVRANRAIEDYGIWEWNVEFGFKIIGNHIETITLPNRLTKIRWGAFEGCTSLTNITIPDSVTEIGYRAFSKCISLTNITIPDSVTVIGREAFHGCTILKSFKGKYASSDGRCLIVDGELIAFAPAGLTSYTIPNNVTKIGGNAFYGCTSLTSITIPDSVTEIGYGAFSGCTSLTNINIPNSVTKIERYTFKGCSSLTSITIPDNVTKIGDVAFSGCTSLTSINIPDSVTEIRGLAFEDCTGLTSITIPDSVTDIGYEAFAGCTSLTSITIPNSVTEIGWGAFRGCSSLTSITCLATTPPQITTLGISEEAVIYVPKESINLYKKAEGWEVYKKQIKRIKE